LQLVRFITDSTVLSEECTTQEAANILYSLGKLEIKDADAFESISNILMRQLQDASSQAIANALWAYDVVALDPPVGLMGCWAREKLGIHDIA
jgi:precorrin-6x reductase